MKSTLIAIEGIDGSGKSTLVKYLEEELRKEGNKVVKVATREEEKESIFRTVIEGYPVDPHSPAYMFFFQFLHAHKVGRTKQALNEGKIVVADRWDLSFFVWHESFGFFTKESNKLREEVSRLAFGGLKPTLGIYLNVSVDNALDRRMWRGEVISNLDAERRFYNTVINAYKSLAQHYGWVTIDANDGFERVRQGVWELVKEVIK